MQSPQATVVSDSECRYIWGPLRLQWRHCWEQMAERDSDFITSKSDSSPFQEFLSFSISLSSIPILLKLAKFVSVCHSLFVLL